MSNHISSGVSPQILIGMGKEAASLSETCGLSLSDAVVHTIGQQKLSSEQIRRVVESANGEMFQRKFASMDPDWRYVEVDGGPADPTQVIQELASKNQPQEIVVESADYEHSPSLHKTASHTPISTHMSEKRAMGEVHSLRRKLSMALESVTQTQDVSQWKMESALEALVGEVKRASREGASRDDLHLSWSEVDPRYAQYAIQKLGGITQSTGKTAGRRINPSHSVVTTFSRFVKEAGEYRTAQCARNDLETQLARVDEFLKESGAGHVAGKGVAKGAEIAGRGVAKGAEITGKLLGGAARTTGKAIRGASNFGGDMAEAAGVTREIGQVAGGGTAILGGYHGARAGHKKLKQKTDEWAARHNFGRQQQYYR